MLGHNVIGGALIAGYNKSRFTPDVAEALQKVGDFLDSLESGQNKVVTFNSARRA
jgi:hypothetical protein